MKEFTSDLFVESPAYARITDLASSKEAAEEMRKSKANRLEQLVILALKESPSGLTNHELVDRTGVNWATQSGINDTRRGSGRTDAGKKQTKSGLVGKIS